MYLLKGNFLFKFFIIFVALMFSSCQPGGALTPEQAFYTVKKHINNIDSEGIKQILSDKSKKKIINTLKSISKMDEKQLELISAKYNYPINNIKSFSVSDFITQYIFHRKSYNLLINIVKHKITAIDIRNNRAQIKVDNGMIVDFVKEGPYWRLDLTDF
jgi:hypothetical protein